MSDGAITDFVHALATHPPLPHVQNPWDLARPENEVRRQNLRYYLQHMYERSPAVLLVGEAPGYRGCGRVGIPFTSERQVLQHPFFTARSGYAITHADTPVSEASASIVWQTFDRLQFYPLMWATFPFHPHQPGNPASNRAPTTAEIGQGQPFLRDLMDLFAIREVLAVGRVAERTLHRVEIPATAIRHPSHGGARQFAEGLAMYVT